MNDDLLKSCRSYLESIDEKLNYITADELKIMIDRGDNLFLLDNRTPSAFASGHIKGATNIWLRDAVSDKNLKKLPKDKKIIGNSKLPLIGTDF